MTLTRVRTGSFDAADTVASRILDEDPFPNVFEIAHVESDDVRASIGTFRKYTDQELSFTGASSIRLCESRDLGAILSFNDDFDGRVERIGPRH